MVALSVVIPCYNEEACLDELYRRVAAVARGVAEDDHEILLVNDGSRDGTWTGMQRLAATDPRLTVINLARNHGHQLALTAGLDLARGDTVLIIDADLQDPPELLPAMLETMRAERADVVYGVRRERAGESAMKKFTASVFYRLLARLTDTRIPLDAGDFRLMSRRALNALLAMPEQSRFIRGMVAWVGFRQVPFAYDRPERFAGETHYPFSKMLRLALDAVTGFSTAPLRLASHAGLVLTGLSVLIGLYIAVAWVRGHTVAGWTSLMLLVLGIGAVQMFVLGLIGEYIGRLYIEAKRRPLYIVADVIGGSRAGSRLGHRADSSATSDSPGSIGIRPTR